MMVQPDGRRTMNFQRFANGAAASVLLVGSFALVGSLALGGPAPGARLPAAPELAAVRTTDALIILLSGLGLRLSVGRSVSFRRRYARVCAALVAAAGALALCAALAGAFQAEGRVAGLLAGAQLLLGGPLPVNAALTFIALGAGLLLLDVETAGGHRPSQIFAMFAVLTSVVAMIGYAYDVEPLYHVASSPPLPFYAAASFGALGAGMLAVSPDSSLMRLRASDAAGGRMIIGLPAALIAGLLAFGWLALELQRAFAWEATLTFALFVVLNTTILGLVTVAVAASLERAETRRRQAEQAMRARAAHQASVASLGQRALSGVDLEQLLSEAATLVASTLQVDFCEVLECCDADLIVLRTCAGWREKDLHGAVGRAMAHPVASFALTRDVPVVVEDFTRDIRFPKPLPERLQVAASGTAVVVPRPHAQERPFGVLAVYTRDHRTFGHDDFHFLETIAAVLCSAIDRARTDETLRRSEAKFASIFRFCPDAISLSTVAEGRFVDVNASFLRVTGYTTEAVLSRTASELPVWAHPADREKLIEHARTGKGRGGLEIDFRTRSGEVRTSLCFTELITLGDDECLLMLARDISERKRVAAMAEEANDHLRRSVAELERQTREISLLNDMSDLLHSCMTIPEAAAIVVQFAHKLFPNEAGALCLLSDNGSLVEAAGTWGNLAPEECLFKPSECWALRRGRAHVSDDASEAGGDLMALRCPHLTTPGPAFSICVPMMAQNETLGLLHVRHPAGPREDVDTRALVSLSEAARRLAVTLAEHVALAVANLKLRETLRTQSILDQLTGLLNRRYMEESLDRELLRASRSQSPLGLVLLDVDRLKHVNDTLGHEAGDKLLQTVSRFLQRRTRADDILCRMGGDEFVLVMPGASLSVAQDRADHILTDFRRVVIDFSGHIDIAPSLSMGLAIFPTHAATGPGLLRAADLALYRAKAEGRDRLAVGWPTE
jgi:diguanylate cyclase (GGDEF)-like protein/PAS domain S-box-containing protein